MAKRIIDLDDDVIEFDDGVENTEEISFDDISGELLTANQILNQSIVGTPPILPKEYFENDTAKRLAYIDRAKTCPRCNKPLVKATAISGSESESWLDCRECGTLINTYRPLLHQVEFLRNPARFKATAGGFGCNPAGTTVVMHDGSLKNVEDIRVGDRVLGPDSMPRTVTQLHRGSEQMYKVDITINGKPVNSFEATGSHVLHLTPKGHYTIDNKVHYLTKPSTNITIDAYLSLSKRARSYLYLSYVVSSKDVLLRRFKVTPTTEQPFYGFTLDGDQLYIDGGTFTVQHNSGKSRMDVEDVIKHVLLIPGSRVCVAARTYPALEATFVKDFYSMFPEKLVKRKNEQKHELTLTNGSEIIFRSFDDPTKLKSLNLSMVVIVEASDVPHEGFIMMQTRLRNTAAMIPEMHPDGEIVTYWDDKANVYKVKYRIDARHINLETNPASNWVKNNFLLEAGFVQYFGSARNENYKMKKDLDPNKYIQVVPTDANPYLPESYVEELSRGKSEAWIQQFIRGSFNFNDNLVFPNFGLCIVAPKALPRAFDEEGKRILYYAIGLDYGLNDNTHIIFTAFSTETKKLYVYDELRINNADVHTIGREYRKQLRMNGTDLRGLLMLPRFDGRSYNKRESDLLTIGGAFEAIGLFFEPSFANHEIRIIKTNALINNNQIEIFSTCEFLIEEALNYTFIVDKEGRPTKTPKDGKDHGITALEFIIAELPHNLKELRLSAYLPAGTIHIHDKVSAVEVKQKEKYYDPFKEDTKYERDSNFGYNTVIVGTYNAMRGFNVHATDDEEDDDSARSQQLGAYVPKR